MTAAAHITGGGIPEKIRRILQPNGLGADIENVFPEPEGIRMLLELANTFPDKTRKRLIDDRRASEQWNRGIGFAIIVKSQAEARKLIRIAEEQGYEAAVAGKTTSNPVISFRGHQWTYSQAV